MLMQEEQKVDLKKKDPEVKDLDQEVQTDENNEIEKVEDEEKTTPIDLTKKEIHELMEKIEEWKAKENDVQVDEGPEETIEEKIEKQKKEIERIKIDGQLDRELKNIKHDETIKDLESKSELFEADQKANALIPNRGTSILWGMVFILIGIGGTFASIVISIASGAKNYSGDESAKIAFLSSIFVIQCSVFFLYSQKTKILTMYKSYSFMFHVITKSLLTVSIYFNFIFFAGDFKPENAEFEHLIFFLTCIIIDGVSVYATSLGTDYITLRVQFRNEVKSLPEMIIYNLFAKLRYNQLGRFNENILIQNEIVKLKGKGNYKAIIKGEEEFAPEEEFIEGEQEDPKKDDVKVEVVEEDPVEETTNQPVKEKEVEKEETINQPIENDNSDYTKKEKDTFLKYIIKYKKEDGLIPSAQKVLSAHKKHKTINLNYNKIQVIKEELYRCNVLIRPKLGGKTGSQPTYFTPEFLERLKDYDGKNLPEISEKYKSLDRENTNKLKNNQEENQEENQQENQEENQQENPIENQEENPVENQQENPIENQEENQDKKEQKIA